MGCQLGQRAQVLREPVGDLPRRPRVFRAGARNTQEAHEAIRPTDLARTPEEVERRLGEDEAALYALVWKRAVGGQMTAARPDRVRVELAPETGDVVLAASGSQTLFDGFLRLYREGSNEDGGDERERALPAIAEGGRVFATEVTPERRFTRPPSRYTEASLVRRLEELGIGRPSTYAAIVDVLRARLRRALPPPLRAHRARPHRHRLSGGLFRAVDRGQFVTSLGGTGAGATVACAKGLHRTAPVCSPGHFK